MRILKSLGIFCIQLVVWIIFIGFAPVMVYLMSGNINDTQTLLYVLACTLVPCMAVYFINYYLLIPYLLFRKKRKMAWYCVINLLIAYLFPCHIVYQGIIKNSHILTAGVWIGITAVATVIMVLEIGSVGIAVAIRTYLRAQAIKMQLNEEKRRSTEAELVWLKNQLNPHFLFNSLNNISSLIYLDGDKAQDCIANLSDLLRYALYEAEQKLVPIRKEIEFMSNYIELMGLRCGESTKISYDFNYENGNLEIVPLLLISLIENAFKHGVSASNPSYIRVSMNEKDGIVTFISENSNFPKPATDRSGRGIGVANTRKRLDLVYGSNYTWKQTSDADSYRVEISINLLKR